MPNRIGMSALSWSQCFSCKTPYTCTNTSLSTWQTSLGDQMSQYRGTHIADMASDANTFCSFLPGLPGSYASSTTKASLQSLNCNFSTSFLSLALELSGKTVGLVPVPLLPQLELLALYGTWSQNCTITTSASNTGHTYGNFSIIVSQCCLHMADLTTRCFSKANGKLLYKNDHDWLVALKSETITITTTVSLLPDDGVYLATTLSNILSCDLALVDEISLTTLSYFFSMTNGHALPPSNSNYVPEPDNSRNLTAIAFDTYFEGALVDQNVLTAR